MRCFHTCVCSTLHLPVEERRFIEDIIADSRAGRSVVVRTDLSIVALHDGYTIHVGVLADYADRPANVPATLWRLLHHASSAGATWLEFDSEEPRRSDLPVYPDDPPPDPGGPETAIRCGTCGSADVMRDAWARRDESTQAWTLGSIFDAAFCNVCEADTTLVETSLAASPVEPAA